MIADDVRRRYRSVLRTLRHECPLILPVRVVLSDAPPPRPRRGRGYAQPGYIIGWSTVSDDERQFRVVLRTSVYERDARRPRRLHKSEVVETLAHEWAHCMAWRADHSQLLDHGPAWALAYGECYRAIIED